MASKTKAKAKAAATEGTAEETVVVIKAVKADGKFRGAREAWYQVLRKHEGKPVDEFLKHTREKPPALTKAGTSEDPRGWMRWFIRNGVVELGQTKAS